jgi:selenide,water dikinase
VPLLADAAALARLGLVTGASSRNWSSYGHEVDGNLDATERALLTDPQTSGGLLVACSPDAVDDVLRAFHADGFDRATVIGRIIPGEPRVVVDAGHATPIAAHRQATAA